MELKENRLLNYSLFNDNNTNNQHTWQLIGRISMKTQIQRITKRSNVW